MKCLLLIACCRIFLVSGQTFTTADFKADFHYLWNAVQTDYCYLADKQTDWQQVKIIYGKRVDTITTLPSFVALLESVLRELYDHHASLSTNTRSSYQLVPSGTNLWGEYLDGKY
ncbi:MAG: hypothetical protein ACXWCZ_11310, partial [Flavisolibacter sp.]